MVLVFYFKNRKKIDRITSTTHNTCSDKFTEIVKSKRKTRKNIKNTVSYVNLRKFNVGCGPCSEQARRPLALKSTSLRAGRSGTSSRSKLEPGSAHAPPPSSLPSSTTHADITTIL